MVPIWFNLIKMLLQPCSQIARRKKVTLVIDRSSPKSCTRLRTRSVSRRQPFQSSLARPSSILERRLPVANIGKRVAIKTGGSCDYYSMNAYPAVLTQVDGQTEAFVSYCSAGEKNGGQSSSRCRHSGRLCPQVGTQLFSKVLRP